MQEGGSTGSIGGLDAAATATTKDLLSGSSKLLHQVRKTRYRLLQEIYWTQLPDTPVTFDVWARYGRALRDLPVQEGFPKEVVWPQVRRASL